MNPIPKFIEGYGDVKSFDKDMITKERCKIRHDLKKLLAELHLRDGMTVSFHHHLRNGDNVMNHVMKTIAELGIKDITLAASSLFPVHEPLVELIKSGVITKIVSNYMSGPVADAVSEGQLKDVAVMQTHGGRARAIEASELTIDIAFIAAPSADDYGNISGVNGPAACGSLGYAISDAMFGKHVVAVTDYLVDYPAEHVEISQAYVDYVYLMDSIGDPSGIVSGTTQITKDPIGLLIAEKAVEVIKETGYLKNSMSFQTGAGGTSLAVAHYLKKEMIKNKIVGSFASGGISGYLVDMYKDGLFKALLDVQCFDLSAIESIKNNSNHQSMSASKYGSPSNSGAVVDRLDVMVLGATEIDLNFNVNVTTGSNGYIMGGSGGHSDTAAGSKLAIVVTKLIKGRLPIVKEQVMTCTTPGETIDVLVTERGIAINPLRQDLIDKLKDSKLPICSIESLMNKAMNLTGEPESVETEDKIVAVVEYRDGRVIDVVRQVINE